MEPWRFLPTQPHFPLCRAPAQLVEYFSERGEPGRVERCVLHMDIASLDFNQVVRLCRHHRLYSALIYVFNRGFNDYVAPAQELLELLVRGVPCV